MIEAVVRILGLMAGVLLYNAVANLTWRHEEPILGVLEILLAVICALVACVLGLLGEQK